MCRRAFERNQELRQKLQSRKPIDVTAGVQVRELGGWDFGGCVEIERSRYITDCIGGRVKK